MMAGGTLAIQCRIDADLKEQLVARCAELNIPQVVVITRGIQAFVEHGAWWLDMPEEPEP